MSNGTIFRPSSAGRISFVSSSFQYSPVGADLVLLLLDDEPKRSHIARTWIGTEIRFSCVNPSCQPNLIMRDHLAAAVRPVSAVISSVLVPVVV
jgi:hypothetical protein